MPNEQSGKKTSPHNSATVLLSSIQATTAALDSGGLKAASSHWLVEDLQPASLIPVDDTPVASGTLTPSTTLSPSKNKTGSPTASAGVLIRSQDLDPDDKDFLGSLTTQLEAGDASESQVLMTPALSVQKREDSDEEEREDSDEEDDGGEPDERVLRGLEESGFGIGFAMDKNKRYRRTMEVFTCFFLFLLGLFLVEEARGIGSDATDS